MSVSDLMTGLMVIFMFIAVAYIKRVQDSTSILNDFVENKQELHDKLKDKFENEEKEGILTIGGDLSMRFQQAQSLFETGSWQLRPEFQSQLAEILPKYLNILLNDSLRTKIREIRIEGHTDMRPYPSIDPDPYIANLILSQRRALSVMQFMRKLPEYKAYSDNDKRLLEYWFTANGLSYGRALDKNNEIAYVSQKPADLDKSRRVEFRIITAGEEVLEHFVQQQPSQSTNKKQ